MEVWDLYDYERDKTDKQMLEDDQQPQGYYRLVVHVCIFNEKGEMLIQQRQPCSKGWSDMWDIGVGGSVIAGENSRQAAEREAFEELGISLSLEGVRPALTINFDKGFDDIYLIKLELDEKQLHLQEEEVKAVKWADEKHIMEMIEEEIFIPYDEALIKMLFLLKDKKGVYTKEDTTVRQIN